MAVKGKGMRADMPLALGFIRKSIKHAGNPPQSQNSCGGHPVFQDGRRKHRPALNQKSLRNETNIWRGAAGSSVWLSPLKPKPLEPMVAT